MQVKDRLLQLKETASAEVRKLEAALRSAKAKVAAFEQAKEAFESASEEERAQGIVRRFLDKHRREQDNLATLEHDLADANGRLDGFEELLRMFPKEGDEAELRATSQMAKIRDLLRAHRQPMSLTDIIKALGLEDEKKARNSLRGSLASYAAKGRVFTKEEGTEIFGLLEFNGQAAELL